jgi:16S rRNA (uracil1498-N3)-methyltransferase
MRLHRFYSDTRIEPQRVGATSLYRGVDQWRKVFRFTTGDNVILFDGSGFDFVCEIASYQRETAEVRVIEVRENHVVAKRETTLCAALVKKDTFEWIVQKATELGVSRIVPILAERSEKKNISMDRLQRIIIEAAEQSGRATLPEIIEPITLEDALAMKDDTKDIASKNIHAVVWEPTAPLFHSNSVTGDSRTVNQPFENSIVTYIGPEGGWSPAELELFTKKGVTMYSMGPQILRAETAAVAALTLVSFL